MSDLIGRHGVVAWLDNMGYPKLADIVNDKKRFPSAEPERKKGQWVKTGQSFIHPNKFRNYSCSECGYDIEKIKYNFCPSCGADMRGKNDG